MYFVHFPGDVISRYRHNCSACRMGVSRDHFESRYPESTAQRAWHSRGIEPNCRAWGYQPLTIPASCSERDVASPSSRASPLLGSTCYQRHTSGRVPHPSRHHGYGEHVGHHTRPLRVAGPPCLQPISIPGNRRRCRVWCSRKWSAPGAVWFRPACVSRPVTRTRNSTPMASSVVAPLLLVSSPQLSNQSGGQPEILLWNGVTSAQLSHFSCPSSNNWIRNSAQYRTENDDRTPKLWQIVSQWTTEGIKARMNSTGMKCVR